jgi:Na+-transporting methylmalonyl-CoA/oxaloacetate decarboxylase gamma subunit
MSSFLLNITDLNGDNLMIALVGYIIVFSALVLLFFVFQNLSKFNTWQTKLRLKKKGELTEKN